MFKLLSAQELFLRFYHHQTSLLERVLRYYERKKLTKTSILFFYKIKSHLQSPAFTLFHLFPVLTKTAVLFLYSHYFGSDLL